MSPYLGIALFGFVICFLAIYLYTKMRLRLLARQERYYHEFARQVADFRTRTDVPDEVKTFVEELVSVPVTSLWVRRAVKNAFRFRAPALSADDKRQIERTLKVLTSLSPDAMDSLRSLIVTFMLAMSHGSFLYGFLYRRLRLRGLTRQTQANVAVETIVTQARQHHWHDLHIDGAGIAPA